MNARTIDPGKVRALVDKMLGLGKEVVGVVIDNDRLQDQGNRQQDKGTATLKSLRNEARAQAKEAKAETMERKERATQRAKSSA
jgi:uncharacterized protein YjbJ (UPF0337 family)